MTRARLLLHLVFAALACAPVRAGDAPVGEQHPAVQKARQYVRAIIARDWQGCAEMLLPAALERRKRDLLAEFDAATPGRQKAILDFHGVASRKELEMMTPQALYISDRTATYRPLHDEPNMPARQLITLDMKVVSTGAEENGRFVHTLIRTHRDAGNARVHELTLVSVVQDDADEARWFVVPDSLLPAVEPIGGAR